MKPQELLLKAAETLKQRGEQNGYDRKEERSAAQIVTVFNAISGRDLTEEEGWLFLHCLKLVRAQRQIQNGNGELLDTLVDAVSYLALRSEALLPDVAPPAPRYDEYPGATAPVCKADPVVEPLPVPRREPQLKLDTAKEECLHAKLTRLKTRKGDVPFGFGQFKCRDCGVEVILELAGLTRDEGGRYSRT